MTRTLRRLSTRRRRTGVALLATVAVVIPGVANASSAGSPVGTPGAESAGYRLFPNLGNGGYDAHAYHVSYDYRPDTTTMRSSVVMHARATQNLSRFSLDSVGQQIHGVTVNGRRADFHLDRDREKLMITPSRAVYRGLPFVVRVDYTVDRDKNPLPPAYPSLPPGMSNPLHYWNDTPHGFALEDQPDRHPGKSRNPPGDVGP